jgi:hypothetical protein
MSPLIRRLSRSRVVRRSLRRTRVVGGPLSIPVLEGNPYSVKHGTHQPYSVEERDDETHSTNHQKNHALNSEIYTWGRKLYRKGEDRSRHDQKDTYSGLHSLQPKGQVCPCEPLRSNAATLFSLSSSGGCEYALRHHRCSLIWG